MPISKRPRRREKLFGQARGRPLDRNAKARIVTFSRAWSTRVRQPRQHKGPITRAFREVLDAMLWGFHNSKDGRCFPSYTTIAAKAGCARSVVASALKVLELAGVLTWVHRIARIRIPTRDANGRVSWRVRIIRTSNAYTFNDPKSAENRPISPKSENRLGTMNQDTSDSNYLAKIDPNNPLERALRALELAFQSRGSGSVGKTVAHTG